MTKEDIGAQIKSRRVHLKLTQKDLADKLKMSVQHIPNIEKGVTNLTIKSLLAICAALDMEIKINPLGEAKQSVPAPPVPKKSKASAPVEKPALPPIKDKAVKKAVEKEPPMRDLLKQMIRERNSE